MYSAKSNFKFAFQLSVLIVLPSLAFAQTTTDFQKEMERFKSWAAKDQSVDLQSLQDPKIQSFVQIAERAEKRIFTPDNNELRKLARDVEKKLIALQTNDVGRWAATRPDTVATFIKLDTDNIELNDVALNIRRERLKTSVETLSRYRSSTQGRFSPEKNPAVLAILEDANWVEEHYRKLTNRLALLQDLENQFPKGKDWSKLPTLRDKKLERIASLFEQRMSAEQKGLEDATRQSSEMTRDSVFEREMQRTKTQLAAEETLARFQRQLMETEFGERATEIEKRIMASQLRKKELETEIVNMEADSEQSRLESYLTSPRVKQLLAPFCSEGWSEAKAGAGQRKIKDLKPGPMSYTALARYQIFSADQRGMKGMFTIANHRFNDRPAWGATLDTFADGEPDFKNMEGKMVNRYIEAQRILREHGSTLVELKILRR